MAFWDFITRGAQAPAKPAQAPQRSTASKWWDQINPLDNGRTYQNPYQTNSRSVIGQLTHNGATNTVGNLTVKPFMLNPAQTAIETGRMAVADATNNAAAQRASQQRQAANLNNSVLGFLFNNGKNIGNAGYNLMFKAPLEAAVGNKAAEQQARDTGLRSFNASTVGQAVRPVTAGLSSLLHLTPEQQSSVGLDPNATGAQKYFADPIVGAAGTYAMFDPIGAVKSVAAVPENVQSLMAERQAAKALAAQAVLERVRNAKEAEVVATPTKAPTKAVVAPEAPIEAVTQPIKVAQNKLTQGGRSGRQNISPETQQAISGEHVVRNTEQLRQRGIQAVDSMKLDDAINTAHERLAVKPGRIGDEDVSFVTRAMERADAEGRSADATALHDSLSEHLVASGQAIQAASLLYQRTPQGMVYKALRDLGRAGVEVTEGMKGDLKKLADNIKASDNQLDKMKATAEFSQAVTKLMPQTASDQVTSVWKAGMLSGVKTQMGNALSNATFGVAKAASDPFSAFYDRIFSAVTGERTKTATQRGYGSGVVEGAQRGIETLRTGFDERNYNGGKYEQHAELNFKNPIVQKVFGTTSNMVFRGMNAADQPWYYAALKRSLYDIAKADGINKGLRGNDLGAYVAKMVSNPTESIANAAKAAADKATLNYDTIGSKAVQGIHRGIDSMQGDQYAMGRAVGHGVVNVLAPFVRVPTAFIARSLDYTPVGAVKGIVHAAYDAAKGRAFDQRALSEALGEATTGTAVIFIGGTLAGSGIISGQQPQDQKEAARWKAEGITPNSIKLGNKWVSLNYLGPAGILLGMGRDYHDAAARGDNGTMVAIAGAGKTLTGQSFLTGFSGFSNAIQDPQRSAKSFINSEAGSVVPAWVNDVANLGDKYQRETNSPLDAVKARVPVARNSLPTKQDVYGNPLEQRASGSTNEVVNRLNVLLNPLRPSDATTNNNVISEVSRLHSVDVNNKDLQVTPTPIDKKLSVGGVQVQLDDKQRHELQMVIGQATQANWSKLIQTPQYQALSDADKATALDNLRKKTTEAVQRNYVYNNNLGTFSKNPSPGVSEIMFGTADIASYAKPHSGAGGTSSSSTSATGTPKPPKVPRVTTTTYDPATNTWTQVNKQTGRTVSIDANGIRTVLKKGASTRRAGTGRARRTPLSNPYRVSRSSIARATSFKFAVPKAPKFKTPKTQRRVAA